MEKRTVGGVGEKGWLAVYVLVGVLPLTLCKCTPPVDLLPGWAVSRDRTVRNMHTYRMMSLWKLSKKLTELKQGLGLLVCF